MRIGGGLCLGGILPQKYEVVLLVGRKEGCLVQFPFANRVFFLRLYLSFLFSFSRNPQSSSSDGGCRSYIWPDSDIGSQVGLGSGTFPKQL